jgi:methylthioribose-1-phosphate isomerase
VQSDLSDGVERRAQLNVAEQESVETVSILNPRLQPGQRHVVQSKNSSQQSETISGMQNQEARAAFASGGLSFLQQSGFSHQTNETQNRSAFAAPENTSQAKSAFGRPA